MKQHKIQKLTPNLANQIAAGEVVARPASVFKETLENSLDAGATKIEINLEDGGLKLIEIRDNGFGINKAELELAITRHATSKIASLTDLENVASFGFRGEALAAISSVSRFELISCAKGEQDAWRLSFDPTDAQIKITQYPHLQGTSLIVRDLFFNTPARRKFLRTPRTEFNHIEKSLRNFALSFPNIAFKLRHNDKIIWDLNSQNLMQRCNKILGTDFIAKSLPIDAKWDNWHLRGFVGTPQIAKATTDSQYFFVNNRSVTDKVVIHAIKQAYADIMYGNRQAAFVLFLDMPADELDVNVHPTKNEVRFRQSNRIHSFIYTSLHKEISKPLASANSAGLFAANSTQQNFLDEETLRQYDALNLNSNQNYRTDSSPQGANYESESMLINLDAMLETPHQPTRGVFAQADVLEKTNLVIPLANITTNKNSIDGADFAELDNFANSQNNLQNNLQQTLASSLQIPPMGFALAQIKDTFILSENSQGLLIVDMHAAHERIIYEKMKLELAKDKITSQKLLFAFELELDAFLVETAEENLEFLASLGLEIEIICATKLALKSFPSILQQENAVQLTSEILQDLQDFGSHKSWQISMERCLTSMACQGAWRTGKKLNLSQMNYLLREMETTPNSDECCHGRLTWKQFTLANLDAFFKRGQ